jgi:uncharacterized protein
MGMGFERSKVAFLSSDVECVGYLYEPADTENKLPCIVLANGFSGTMDWLLPGYAERFVAAGFIVLVFDYRYFGESNGEPRQLVSVSRQRQDLREAIRFARSHRHIDPHRVALWGTSLGGGHVIAVAAEDAKIAAVVAQVPGIDMVNPKAKATIKVPATIILKLIGAAVLDALRGAIRMTPYYVKVFGKPTAFRRRATRERDVAKPIHPTVLSSTTSLLEGISSKYQGTPSRVYCRQRSLCQPGFSGMGRQTSAAW